MTELLTPGPPEEVNLQAVFDKVLFGLRQQGELSIDLDSEGCFYRHNGLCCAIGWLIPDDRYTPFMEGATAEEVRWRVQELGVLPPDFLHLLQDAHDSAEGSMDLWECSMQALAKAYSLNYTPPEEVCTPS